MKVITPPGAIGSSRRLTSSKRWKSPSAPTRNAVAGKNASSELYAICCARPMQSSLMNSEKLRFNTAIHSPRLSRSGERGTRPAAARRCSVAVDKAEAAELGLRLAFAPAPEDQTRARTDPTRQEEADAERAHGDGRQVLAQLSADVRRLAEARAQAVRRVGQLLAFRLDLPPDVGDGARVATGHCSSTPRSSAWPRGSPAREPAAF